MSTPSFNEWLKQEGHAPSGKWVLARATLKNLRKYPESTFFTQKRYDALVEEHRVLCRTLTVHQIAAKRGLVTNAIPALVEAFEAGRAAH